MPNNPRTFRRTYLVLVYLTAPFVVIIDIPWLGGFWALGFGLVYIPMVLRWPVMLEWFGTCVLAYYLLTCLVIRLIVQVPDPEGER